MFLSIAPDFCLPTCAVPNPPDCPYIDYSVCGKGRVLSDVDGECINISDCPGKNRIMNERFNRCLKIT